VKITMKPSPKIESSDGQYSFQPFGRVHFDVSTFDDDASDRSSNANLRTSSNYIMTMERSAATNAFTRSEMLGANLLGGGENWSWGLGVFNEDAGNSDTGDDEDISVDGRITTNVLALADANADNVLHVGAGVSHRRPTGNVRFRARPVGDGANIIDTGNFGSVDSVNVVSAELGSVVGPFTFQGEYFDTEVNREGGNSDANFDGYVAQAGWLLTGESRIMGGEADVTTFGVNWLYAASSLKTKI